MATNHTENYNLNLWEPSDTFQRTEFNENSQKIDAALKAEADARSALAAGKADAAALTALAQTVAGKGNCHIVTGSYTGTSKYNYQYPNTLTFDGKPLLVAIAGGTCCVTMVRSASTAIMSEGFPISVIWKDTSINYFSSSNAERQLNSNNVTYHYVALLADEID